MNVIEFRFLQTDEATDLKYEAWSRIYEYPYVLNTLKKLGASDKSSIHNTSWGFAGCHLIFKNDLDTNYKNTLHSDIKESNLNNTIVYDICKKIEDKYLNYFDFVLNISTVEEVGFSNDIIIANLFEQVKPGGYLIITFDYSKNMDNSFGNGSINLPCVENYTKAKIQPMQTNSINGNNSALPNYTYSHLNCGVLVIQKTI